jgi:FkbM family methyltransferase
MNDMISHSQSVAQAVCRHGTFSFPDDMYIGQSMRMYGEYSEQEVAFLCSLLKPGGVVVEAGANIGAITVPMAKVVGGNGGVFAYEPQEVIFNTLVENTSRELLCVIAMNDALGKVEETRRYSSNSGNTGGVALSDSGDHAASVIALDSIAMDHVDLLKIDVEGMETDVLVGARKTIMRSRPLIYVENDRPKNKQRVVDTLFAYGYRVWRHEPPLFNPDNFKGVKENLWPNVVSFNLIAAPEEKDVPAQVAGLTEVLYDGPPAINVVRTRWACVARMGGYGDNLMVSSVFPGLKDRYDRLEVISRAPCHEVFLNNPYIDKLTVWPKDEQVSDVLEWTRAMARRLAEYDFAVHLSHSCEGKLVFFETQTEFWWPEKMRRRLADHSYLGYIHDICDLPHAFAPNFFPTEAEISAAKAVIAQIRTVRDTPVVGWCLSGSRIDKAYPGSAAAIARLLEDGLNVVMFGAPGKEFLMSKEIERQLIQQTGTDERGSSPGLYLAMSDNVDKPNWLPRRAFSTLQACDAVVTPDTGPLWSVAMRSMPKVALLSHASPLNITSKFINTVALHADPVHVPCWSCHRLHDHWGTCNKAKDVDAAACMADIPVNLIVKMVVHGINGGKAGYLAENSQVTWA